MDQPGKRRSQSLLLAAQHQLRQPLNALSLLIGELRQGPSGRELAAIADEMRYALQLSNGWLQAIVDLERVEQGLVEPQPIAVPLQEIFDRLREEFAPRCAEHGLALRVVPTRATVRADPAILHRILALLLDNAVKFTPAGRLLLGCRRAGDGLRVELWDSGPGLSSDDAQAVFEPFIRLENEVRPRERGLGLGLAYAQQLAALAGERLTVAGRPGRGCCFALTLGSAAGAAGLAERSAADALGNPLAGAEVVLLEGSDSARLREYLESWGAAVRVVVPKALAAAVVAAPRLVIADRAAFGAAGGWQLARPPGTAVLLVGDLPAEPSGVLAPGIHALQRPVRPARLRALCHFAMTRPAEAPADARSSGPGQ